MPLPRTPVVSMRVRRREVNRLVILLFLALAGTPGASRAFGNERAQDKTDTSLLHLEVFINDVTTGLIGEFRLAGDGVLMVRAEELREVGIRPSIGARASNGWIVLDRLPGVAYRYDEPGQILYFTTTDAHREPRRLNGRGRSDSQEEESAAAESGYGAYANYRLYASFQNEKFFEEPAFQGISGAFDTVAFSPFGNINHSFITKSQSDFETPETIRLNTSWNFYHQRSLTSYKVGDLITGGLLWTRPVYLGGLQVRRNFGLRPDLVTMPVPSLSGSAAVPSTVEVYTNGNRSFQADIPGGPFQVDNLPVVSGPGTARLVIRDASGREVVQDVPFYTSSKLLAAGLVDFSVEAGYVRNYYGVYSDAYDNRLMGFATARWGWTDRITLEGHMEGGDGLFNGGVGATFAVGRYGVAAGSVSSSYSDGRTGYQLSGSLDADLGNWSFYVRSQRSFGDYADVASATAQDSLTPSGMLNQPVISAAPPRALDQLSLSFPLLDKSAISFNFVNQELDSGTRYQLASVSHSRQILGGTGFVSGFVDLANDSSFGLFVGFSRPLGSGRSASISAATTNSGTSIVTQANKNEENTPGSYGWRLVDAEGADSYRGAGASYRGNHGRIEASAQQYEDNNQFTATISGAIVATGGDVFLSNQVNDAFAVVDAGAAGVAVASNNRPMGRTGRSGKLLVPDLPSYLENSIALDPVNLPVDSNLAETHRKVVVARQSGVVLDFGDQAGGGAAIVGFVDTTGAPISLGSSVAVMGADSEENTVGYDGQAFLRNLKRNNEVEINLPDGKSCRASFSFKPQTNEQAFIEGVVCR